MHLRARMIGVLCLLVSASTLTAGEHVSNWTFQMEYVVDTVGVGFLREPSWSTSGSIMAVKGKDGIYIHDLDSRRTSLVAKGEIRQFVWLPGKKLVYELEKNVGVFKPSIASELHMFDLNSLRDKVVLQIPIMYVGMLQATSDGRAAFTNEGRNSEWKADIVDTSGTWTPIDQTNISDLVWEQGGVPCIRANGVTRRIIVEGEGRLWGTKPSPDGTFLFVGTQADTGECTVIATNQGKWVKVLPSRFHACQWSSDDRILLGVEENWDFGHRWVESSKLALVDLQSHAYTIIEPAQGMIPLHPSWNEHTGRLAFADQASQTIIVGTLKENSD